MEKIACFTDGGGGYDWEEAGLYRDKSGHLWWSAQAGCSCNYYQEPTRTGGLIEVTSLAQASRLYDEAFVMRGPGSPWADVVEVFIEAGVR